MLIKALYDYYDFLAQRGEVVAEGFSKVKIHFMILLTPQGDVADIVDIREPKPVQKGKKEKIEYFPREMILPKRTEKSAVDLNIIDHRPLYIFGLNFEDGAFTPDDRTNRARKSHQCFVEGNLAFTEGMTSEIVMAYRNFLLRWNPEEQRENPILLKIGKDYNASGYCFALNGHPEIRLHEDGEMIAKWRAMQAEKGSAEETGVCSITGETASIARIHDKIRGLGNATGNVLVMFNSNAEESYGKKQSFNSSISEDAMKRYTAALNYLLANPKHRAALDDMTIVFWAMAKEEDAMLSLFRTTALDDAANAEDIDDFIGKAMKALYRGEHIDMAPLNIDENVAFYIVGMVPNSARISVKFIYQDQFGKLFQNILQHQLDIAVRETQKQVPLKYLIPELRSPKSTKKDVPPPLVAALFSAVLHGTRYPSELLDTVLQRIKTDNDPENEYVKINPKRVGLVKACLNRNARFRGQKEEITLALNKENTDPAYACGRLFALLEDLQVAAARPAKLNRTIRETYFASACAKPLAIFPTLVQLATHHLQKLEGGLRYYFDYSIHEVIDILDGTFPRTLTHEQQGAFVVGYYQQRYIKKGTEENGSDSEQV